MPGSNAMTTIRLLALNAGSSSLKAAIFDMDNDERRILSGEVSAIAAFSPGEVYLRDEHGTILTRAPAKSKDHRAAAGILWPLLRERCGTLDGIGHRVVHGGARLREPAIITDDVRDEIHGLEPLDPDHTDAALAGIDLLREAYPSLPQVACFDTAFHGTMSAVARLLPLPRALLDEGIQRYGFHGLSYEFVMAELRRLDPGTAGGRIVIAHLGSGASMAAVQGGLSIDTTMGFTPAGGLMMGTRTGDLDPGVLVHLLRTRGMDVTGLNALINREGGLLGVSARSGEMNELLSLAATDPNAAEALDLYCYTAKKHLGALVAILGGLDILVFTGGIGERAPAVRARICEELEFLGITIDDARNRAAAPIISPGQSPVTIRIIPTDEERMVARHTAELIRRTSDHAI